MPATRGCQKQKCSAQCSGEFVCGVPWSEGLRVSTALGPSAPGHRTAPSRRTSSGDVHLQDHVGPPFCRTLGTSCGWRGFARLVSLSHTDLCKLLFFAAALSAFITDSYRDRCWQAMFDCLPLFRVLFPCRPSSAWFSYFLSLPLAVSIVIQFFS